MDPWCAFQNNGRGHLSCENFHFSSFIAILINFYPIFCRGESCFNPSLNILNNFKGGRGIRRIFETWLNRQSPFDLWRNNRGFGYFKSVIKRLHYKPADSGLQQEHFQETYKNDRMTNDRNIRKLPQKGTK